MEENHFTQYGLSKEIIEALDMLSYKEPTEIQREVIPHVLDGKDVVAKSKTGSGKTAAFAIPICEMVQWEENLPQVIVLEPTRELAYQVKDELFNIGRKKRLKVPVVFGGFPIEKQVLTLKQKSHIVVGTPGRVLDHLRRGSLSCEKVKVVVVDEADLMLDMGFWEDVKQILQYTNGEKQLLLFSATMGNQVQEFATSVMKSPVTVEIVSDTQTVDLIVQEGYMVENEEKFERLMQVIYLEAPTNCMIFCATREMVNVLTRQMKKARIRCGMLHGLLDQQERLQTIEAFREGRFSFLIATDVAARGVDFEEISHVINYDLPSSKDTYVHRIGRTGRNGKKGKAISFIQKSEHKLQNIIETYTNATITICEQPLLEEIDKKKKEFYHLQSKQPLLKKKKGDVFKKQIATLRIGGGRKSKIRALDIVGTICSIPGIDVGDIGIIDIRDSLSFVEILNGKGNLVVSELQHKTLKGKLRKVSLTK